MNIKEPCCVVDAWAEWVCPVAFLDDGGSCVPHKHVGRT